MLPICAYVIECNCPHATHLSLTVFQNVYLLRIVGLFHNKVDNSLPISFEMYLSQIIYKHLKRSQERIVQK